MRNLIALFSLFQAFLLPSAVAAQDYAGEWAGARVVTTTSWTEEWDPVSESWVRVADTSDVPTRGAPQPAMTITTLIVNGKVVGETTQTARVQTAHAATRYAVPMRTQPQAKAIAQYGPFRVLDGTRAAVIGTTGPQSPAQFDAMMRDFPQLEVLEMVDAGGTSHDLANLEVGRRIRAAGLTTHVPEGGSARSGGVELFLAGEQRTMASGAQFAVHSWLDNYGREPDDFAADAPENRLYLDYYVEMGMSESRAHEFYAMTNSVPHSGALWLKAGDMQPWIMPERARQTITAPKVRMVMEAPLATPSIDIAPVTLAVGGAIGVDVMPMIDYSDLTRFTFAQTGASLTLSMASVS